MRRIGTLAAAACFLAAWPATAAAAPCERERGGARFAATVQERAVAICDRMRGARRIVRRVRAPLTIREARVVGPRVAWIERRRGGARTLYARHLLVPGPARVLDRGSVFFLRSADGVTLSWWNAGAYRFVDFAPPPMEDGCPLRSGFRTVEQRDGLRVTAAVHGRGYDLALYVWRACRLGSGRDPVVLVQPETAYGNGTVVRAAGAGAGVVAFVFMFFTRYDGCDREHVVSVDADTGERVRVGADDWCGTGAAPPERTRAAVTAAGAVAWVQDGALRAVTASGAVEVLDRGAIGALRAEGDVLRWTNAGAPREARP
jgi:hypothetical protein